MSAEFVLDTARNQIADKLSRAFFGYYRYKPSPGELNSWRNSLRAMAQVLQLAGLRDQGVLLEYELPQTSKRLDCMICGHDGGSLPQAVIVELKQWGECAASDAENLVMSWVGGRQMDLLHPSVQVDS